MQGWVSPPFHTLRSFNYLMQNAGIMPGHLLKGAPAFICWDGSPVRREEKGFAWVRWSLLMFPSKTYLSLSPSNGSIFAFQFPSSFWHTVFSPTFFYVSRLGSRRLEPQVEPTGQLEGKPHQWLHIWLPYFSTGLNSRDPGVLSSVFANVSRRGWAQWERFHQERSTDQPRHVEPHYTHKQTPSGTVRVCSTSRKCLCSLKVTAPFIPAVPQDSLWAAHLSGFLSFDYLHLSAYLPATLQPHSPAIHFLLEPHNLPCDVMNVTANSAVSHYSYFQIYYSHLWTLQ